MPISNLVKQLREDLKMIPGAVGHNYSEDHQSAPRARRSQSPHITGCMEGEAVSLRWAIFWANPIMRNYWRHYIGGWRLGGCLLGLAARQCFNGFAQPLGIKLTRFRKLDDPMSDHIIRDIVAINSYRDALPKRLAVDEPPAP